MRDGVDGLGVRREQHGARVHQVLPDYDLLRRLRAEGADPLAARDIADGHHLREVDLDGAVQLQRIEQTRGRVADGIAASELELAEARVHVSVPSHP